MVAVIVYHLNNAWLPGGFSGVDVFFVISGFVVTRSILFERFAGFIHFSAWFYARRVRRILPALVVVSLFAAAIPALFMPLADEAMRSLNTGLWGLFGASNVRSLLRVSDYFGMDAELDPYTHTWSLGVEEQFYLIFPAILVLLVRPSRGGVFNPRQGLGYAWTILGLLLSASILTAMAHSVLPQTGAFYLMPTRFWELGTGVGLALWDAHYREAQAQQATKSARGTVGLGVATFALLGVGFVLPFHEGLFPFPLAVPSVAAAAAAIGLGTIAPKATPSRILAHPLLVWLGKRSYSLYLWHWPIFVGYRWTVGLQSPWHLVTAIALTLACSALSYRFVEQPARRLKTSTQHTLLVGALALLVSTGLLMTLRRPEFHPRTYLGSQLHAADWEWLNRPIQFPTGTWHPESCVLRADSEAAKPLLHSDCTLSPNGGQTKALPGRRNLVLMGSSFAEAAVPMLRPLLKTDSFREVSAYAAWGCIPGLDLVEGHPWALSCKAFSERIVPRLIAELHPGDIVFLAYDTSTLADSGPTPSGSLAAQQEANRSHLYKERPTTPEIRRHGLRDALIEMSQTLQQKRASLVFQATTPMTRGTNPRRCQPEWFRPDSTAREICPTFPKAHHLSMREPVLEVLRQVKQKAANFYVFDPFEQLCVGDPCGWFENGRPVWRDDVHVTEWKSEELGTVLHRFLLAEGLLRTPLAVPTYVPVRR